MLIRAALLFALVAVQAVAADLPAVGTRQIGTTTFLVDKNGMTVGTVKELSPGNWHVMDSRGMTVSTVQTPPGSPPPVVLGPVRR